MLCSWALRLDQASRLVEKRHEDGNGSKPSSRQPYQGPRCNPARAMLVSCPRTEGSVSQWSDLPWESYWQARPCPTLTTVRGIGRPCLGTSSHIWHLQGTLGAQGATNSRKRPSRVEMVVRHGMALSLRPKPE